MQRDKMDEISGAAGCISRGVKPALCYWSRNSRHSEQHDLASDQRTSAKSPLAINLNGIVSALFALAVFSVTQDDLESEWRYVMNIGHSLAIALSVVVVGLILFTLKSASYWNSGKATVKLPASVLPLDARSRIVRDNPQAPSRGYTKAEHEDLV